MLKTSFSKKINNYLLKDLIIIHTVHLLKYENEDQFQVLRKIKTSIDLKELAKDSDLA